MIISKDGKNFITVPNTISTNQNVYIIDNDSNRLGVGGNAAVYECTDRTGNIWAIKFLLNLSKKARKRFTQEIDLLRCLDHPHIIKCIDNGMVKGRRMQIKGRGSEKIEKSNRGYTFHLPFLVMEKADTNIVDYMFKSGGSVGYDVYAPQIRGLAHALGYLHQRAIYRDIKPENILVRGEVWLLSDLGLCTAVNQNERIDVTKMHEHIGPKYWPSPEATDSIYFGTHNIDATSDVYQLCAVFWFIITRRYPLGVIDSDDYATYDIKVCQELLKSLKYNKAMRTQTGAALYENICNATINRR
jgi:serine/threonine-protein kinase